MATFVLIHGGGDVGWHWHLLQRELSSRGHESVAPDLPCDDDDATLVDYADTVVEAVGDRRNLVVVGHSYGAFTAPLVADRLRADALVLLAGMIPSPGEAPADWWSNTGHKQAVREQAKLDGGKTGNKDPMVTYYHDVPRALAEEALRRERGSHRLPRVCRGHWTRGRRADEIRAVQGRSRLPGEVLSTAGSRAPGHHA